MTSYEQLATNHEAATAIYKKTIFSCALRCIMVRLNRIGVIRRNNYVAYGEFQGFM